MTPITTILTARAALAAALALGSLAASGPANACLLYTSRCV